MPTIHAADPPYTGVPTTSPQFVPTPEFRIDARPDAFGAGVGRAVSTLGQTFGEAGNVFAKNAIDRQNIFNQVTADDQTNKYSDEETKILYGDPAKEGDHGFFGLSGEAAMRAWPETRNRLLDLRTNIRGNLQNDQQRLLFDRETRTMQQRAFTTMGAHYDSQFKEYTTNTNKAAQDLRDRQITLAAGDQAEVDRLTKEKMDFGYKQLQNQGLENNDDAVYQMMAKARADAVQAQIDGLTGTDNVDRAQQVFQAAQANKVPFTPEHLAAINRSLEAAQERANNKKAAGIGHDAVYPPAGGQRALVPYTPATSLTQGTGLSAEQYDTFRHYLASREASGYGELPNAGGYMGQYQMGKEEIKDAATRLGIPVPSQQEFLSNPELQEKLFENYTLDHHNTLMKESEKYRNASPQERAAILAGAHLGGTTGVQRYLDSGKDARDSNGTSISNYVTSMRRAMSSAPAAPAAPTTPSAPGAPAAEAPKPQAATTPTPSATPAKLEVWGDSLGVGLNNHLKTAGYSHGGDTPATIDAKIREKPPEYWDGKTVVLSSGSNGNDMDTVENTMSYLLGKGANVIAVGYGPKFPQKNARLREAAGHLGVPVIDAKDVGAGEGVHPSPSGYRSMADDIRSKVPHG